MRRTTTATAAFSSTSSATCSASRPRRRRRAGSPGRGPARRRFLTPRDLAERFGLAAVPYYGLASGFLTGKYRPGTTVRSARAGRAGKHLDTERGRRVLAALDLVAEEQGTAVATVALAWLAARPTVAAPIASARTLDQLPPLIEAARTTLTRDQLDRLTAASA
ncbi:aldo/keto reductase [Actinomadura welshii]|uniref:aldo/keto reductase n=1 Tax=Actinomadura welshii TaxID=3103817 RepID=UPI0009E0B180|nr:aldo/keto reductase [Actinomadura madurae]